MKVISAVVVLIVAIPPAVASLTQICLEIRDVKVAVGIHP
jgi:hypothetical protein